MGSIGRLPKQGNARTCVSCSSHPHTVLHQQLHSGSNHPRRWISGDRRDRSRAWIANIVLLAATLPQIWLILPLSQVIRSAATLLAVSGFSGIFIRVITEQQQRLHVIATTDPLTGLLNRKSLSENLEQAIVQQQRIEAPMTLVALDLDHFKDINDTLGHDAGDTALRRVGLLLRQRLRRVDKVFRVGGEEFLALLWNTDAQGGQLIAEEIRASFESSSLLPNRPITISIGLATLEPGESWNAWMKRADDNLYQAKSLGRNRIAA